MSLPAKILDTIGDMLRNTGGIQRGYSEVPVREYSGHMCILTREAHGAPPLPADTPLGAPKSAQAPYGAGFPWQTDLARNRK